MDKTQWIKFNNKLFYFRWKFSFKEWHLRSIYKRVETNSVWKELDNVVLKLVELLLLEHINFYLFYQQVNHTTDVIIISDKEVPLFTPTPYYIILPNVTSTAKIKISVNEYYSEVN